VQAVDDRTGLGDRSYPARPLVGVGGVIIVSAGDPIVGGVVVPRPAEPAVVLIKRRFEPLAGHWSLPGGLLEIGETLQAGVAREILEETGLIVDVGPVVEVFDRILLDADGRIRHHYVLIDYVCRIRSGALRAESDAADVAVAHPTDLGSYGVTAMVEEVVGRAIGIVSAMP
jgi:8-oxo-dGTP diphosphatase